MTFGLVELVDTSWYPDVATLIKDTSTKATMPPTKTAGVNHLKGYGRLKLYEKMDECMAMWNRYWIWKGNARSRYLGRNEDSEKQGSGNEDKYLRSKMGIKLRQ